MARTSFHIDPDIEGEVYQLLKDEGFEISVGNGPMVDYVVTLPED